MCLGPLYFEDIVTDFNVPGHNFVSKMFSTETTEDMNRRLLEQEQKQIAVGPGNAHFISIHQVSSDAATLRGDTCGQRCMLLIPPPLLCIGSLTTKNKLLLLLLLLLLIN